MLARCLDRAPAADDLAKVVDVYHDDLFDHGLRDADAERVAEALAAAGRMAERWPRPRDIIVNLPPRPTPPMLDAPELSEQEIQRNLRMVRDAARGKVVDLGK